MTKVMMALGDYRYSLPSATYKSLERVHNWRWASKERLGRVPAQEYLGPGEETISMEGTIYPYFKGGLGQINLMREEAGKGEPLTLVDGLGFVWGEYCIKRISERQQHLDANGIPRRQDFSITLIAYGEDE